jgi:putative heme-binding domain-containing protein
VGVQSAHVQLVAQDRIVGCLCVAAVLFAQDSYTPGEVTDGHRLYLANCAGCHGPEGDAVPGVTLGGGKFRHAASDDDLVQIIRGGISGTAMPPGNFSPFQARLIVAYLRSLAEVAARNGHTVGTASRGEVIFDGKGECLRCHRVKGSGSRLGPDLTDIGNLRTAAELERSLLDPNAEILPQNRFVRVVPIGRQPITGRLLNQDTYSVQLLDSENHLRSLLRSSLKEITFLNDSVMPSYQGKLSLTELQDLVSYLVSLKGIQLGPTRQAPPRLALITR